jgi:uncharacterized protein YlxW (UPF0749 family)
MFLTVWQVKGVKKNNEMKEETSAIGIIGELNAKIKERDNQIADLKKEKAATEEEVLKKLSEGAEGDEYLSMMNDELTKTLMYAGMTDLTGEGIIVTLDDVPQTEEMKKNGFNYGIVHDINISRVVNELKSAGAEAVAVNGKRIVAMSEIRCVGPTVMINNEKVAAPFVIKAIGDSKTLEDALHMSGGVIEEATKLYGISVTTEKSKDVVVEKYVGLTQMKYAKIPDKKGDKK